MLAVAMIIWGAALWYLIRLAHCSSVRRRTVPPPAEPPGISDEPDAGEVLEADLVFARLTGQADVTAYQEAMAALAASTASRAPGGPRYGR